MDKLLDALNEVLSKFDQETKPVSERDVAKAIRPIGVSADSSNIPMQFTAEAMAFDFCEDNHDKATG
jgi:hypothetical protein